jgi:putative transcriptional regulator
MNAPVLQGGPVHTERGFVLHDALWSHEAEPVAEAIELEAAALTAVSDKESVYASTMAIPGGLEMTTSKDVLEALSIGAGPKRVLISLGYSAWGEGQLESELAENSWLTVGADMAVIFDTPVDQRYASAMKLLGLEPWMLSGEVGHS